MLQNGRRDLEDFYETLSGTGTRTRDCTFFFFLFSKNGAFVPIAFEKYVYLFKVLHSMFNLFPCGTFWNLKLSKEHRGTIGL